MEFNEKLQELRKRDGITQEDLANVLHVSRAAVSKWESGRGWPSIDSLKNIADYFSISLDELLSSESLLAIAEDEGKQKAERSLVAACGVIDLCSLVLVFLPVFSVKVADGALGIALPSLFAVKPALFVTFAVVIAATAAFGLAALLLEKRNPEFWRSKGRLISQALACIALLLFIVSQQVYAAAMALAFLLMKVFLLVRRQ